MSFYRLAPHIGPESGSLACFRNSFQAIGSRMWLQWGCKWELREKLAEATSCRNLILRVGKKSLKDFKLEIGFLFEKITLNFC